jgi:hypothetical protein
VLISKNLAEDSTGEPTLVQRAVVGAQVDLADGERSLETLTMHDLTLEISSSSFDVCVGTDS